MEQQTQQAFDDLNAKVTSIESAEQAAETLMKGLNEQLQAALSSSSNPTEVVSAVKAISDRLNTDATQLAAAVTANTPAASGNAGSSSGGSSGTGGSSSSTGTNTGGSSSSGSTGSTSGTNTTGTGAADPTA